MKLIEKITNVKTNYIHYAIDFYLDTKNPLILEIGAHNGDDTLQFSKRYPNGTVYTFEPDPRLTEYLLAKFAKFDNVKFYPKAIYSDTRGIVFNLAKAENRDTFKNTGSSSLLDYTENSAKNFYKTARVDAISLREIQPLQDNEIDVIWIDVQGAERIIIDSHEAIFQKSKIIWIEYGESDYSDYYTRSEIINQFRSTHTVSAFSNRAERGNLLLVRI